MRSNSTPRPSVETALDYASVAIESLIFFGVLLGLRPTRAVSLIYPHRRHTPLRVRVFTEFLFEALEAQGVRS